MIYADYNGSAPVKRVVAEYLIERLKDDSYSNPNASHALGKKTLFQMEKSRRTLARIVGCRPSQIIFNSGASEGISQVFYSLLGCGRSEKKTIVTSGIEHSAVVECCELYKSLGHKVVTIKTLDNGRIDLDDFKKIVQEHKDDIALVTAMAANNETGVVQPFQEIGEICQTEKITFFSDTTQFIGKIDFDFSKSNMDFAVLSSHKVGALIGSGCIIAKEPHRLTPFVLGGGQENGLRGGTQNYIGIETMAVAMEYFSDNIEGLKKLRELRERFEANIQKKFPEVVIIGQGAGRLASTTMISYPGISGQAVQIELETEDIFVTTSSACSDSSTEMSKVLKAMGTEPEIGKGVVRISLCLNANEALYGKIEDALTRAYKKLEPQKVAS